MSNDEQDDINVGQFDPVNVFEQTLYDFVQVVETFQTSDAISPLELLQASRVVGQRLKAISTYTMAAIMSPAASKITPEVREQFQQQIELDELMLSPEEKQRQLSKALRDVIPIWTKRPNS